MLKKLAAVLLLVIAIAAAAYMGSRDGREHAAERASAE